MKISTKGGIELDHLGYIILAVIGLLILLAIVTVVIPGELSNQGERAVDIFDGLN